MVGKERGLVHVQSGKISHGYLFVLALIFLLAAVYVVDAFHIVRVFSGASNLGTNITGRVVEDVAFQYNISVNNTALTADQNITAVNITLPSTFTFIVNSNASNVSGVVGFNVSGTSAVLRWNSTNGLVTNVTLNYFWFNATASEPGNYNITVTTLNATGPFNTTNISVTVNDTTVPSNLAFQGQTPANASFISGNSIFANLSINDNGVITQVNGYLINATGSINGSNISFFQSSLNANYTFNFSGLTADGIYFLNVSANDSFNNINVSLTRTFTIDHTAPTVSLGTATATTSTFSIPVTITDSTTTINGTCTVDRGAAGVVGTGGSQTLNESSLTCGTSYTYTVTCLDQAGNSGNKQATYSTDSCGGSTKSSGSSGSASSTSTWSASYSVSSEQFTAGFTRTLNAKERTTIPVSTTTGTATTTATHTVGILSIDSSSLKATLEIASTPQQVVMGQGETKKFDVTNDNYYDVQVTVNTITSTQVNMTVKAVHDLMPAGSTGGTSNSTSTSSGSSTSNTNTNETSPSSPESKKLSTTIFWIIGIIVVLIIVVVFFLRKQQKSKGYR